MSEPAPELDAQSTQSLFWEFNQRQAPHQEDEHVLAAYMPPPFPTQAVAKWWHYAPGAPGYNRELRKYILDTIGRHRKPAIFTLLQLEAKQNKEAATQLVVSSGKNSTKEVGPGENIQRTACDDTREDMSWRSNLSFRPKWAKNGSRKHITIYL